jgi:hypothetical protein
MILFGFLLHHHNYLVHKLADLLHLDHGQLIEAKLRARDRVT